MTVEIDAIARDAQCDVGSLKLALPLLEQGYLPPFLAKYRRDELSGVAESPLWALYSEIQRKSEVTARREEVLGLFDKSSVVDGSIRSAIQKARSVHELERLLRTTRTVAGGLDEATRLAIRLLNPETADTTDLTAIATSLSGDEGHATKAVEQLAGGLKKAIPHNQAIVDSAARWLERNAKIKIGEIRDPHGNADPVGGATPPVATAPEMHPAETAQENAATEEAAVAGTTEPLSNAAEPASPSKAKEAKVEEAKAEEAKAEEAKAEEAKAEEAKAEEAKAEEAKAEEAKAEEAKAEEAKVEEAKAEEAKVEEAKVEEAASESASGALSDKTSSTQSAPTPEVGDVEGTSSGDVATKSEAHAADGNLAASELSLPTGTEVEGGQTSVADRSTVEKTSKKGGNRQKSGGEKKPEKQKKKISPRQRRRRWLVSVLKPLSGKKMTLGKLSAFQVLMLARGLRSSVAEATFDYDRAKLIQHLQKTATHLNQKHATRLRDALAAAEAEVCAAAEEALWDDAIYRASCRLTDVITAAFRRMVFRKPVSARGVIAIDAVGPRTAALAVLNSAGDVVHTEDIPCQLSKSLRDQAVTKLGELCHKFHADAIVISNGPARRNCLVALSELLEQSQPGSLHWALADRSGADIFASADSNDMQIRRIPRRFRAAAWIGLQLLDPVSAYSKIDCSRLRLSSYQRELSDKSVRVALGQVLTSGVSTQGADLNSADVRWLAQMPGVTPEIAEQIDRRRRANLYASRLELSQLPGLTEVQLRQMLPFLRVFGSEQPLDATLIHPDDYKLAEKLCNSLDIPMPPASPPGYQPPVFEEPSSEQTPEETSVDVTASDAEVAGQLDAEAVDASFGVAMEESATVIDQDDAVANADETEMVVGSPEFEERPATDDVSESSPLASQGDAADIDASEPGTDIDASESGTVIATEDTSAEPDPDGPTDEKDATATETVPEPMVEMPRHPLPDQAKIEKVVKEWQVGRHRVTQLVHWLCEPFSVPALDLHPAAMMPAIPKLDKLVPGDFVAGVVVGVAKFGVFVELGPDCSGLIHVSRLSDGYVEDPHELMQVGDVVEAYVTAIETSRRRVALSSLSPAQEQAAAAARNQRSEARAPRGHGGGRGRRSEGGQRSSSNTAGATQGRAPSGAGEKRGGHGKPSGGRSRTSGPGGSGRDRKSGHGRGGRPGGRSHEPRSFTVKSSKEPEKLISDDMKAGEEPLRSFSDLMQFYQDKTEPPKRDSKSEPAADAGDAQSEPASPEGEASAAPVVPEPGTEAQPVSDAAAAQHETVEEQAAPQVQPHRDPPASSDEADDAGSTKEQV